MSVILHISFLEYSQSFLNQGHVNQAQVAIAFIRRCSSRVDVSINIRRALSEGRSQFLATAKYAALQSHWMSAGLSKNDWRVIVLLERKVAMEVAIIGGSGKVGSTTARALRLAGHQVRIICRTKSAVPEDLLDYFCQGDLSQPDSLALPLRGVEALLLITPSVETETQMGLAALRMAQATGVQKLVYMATMTPELMQAVPHFFNKLPIKQAVIAGWQKHVILQPNYFFQNDAVVLQALVHGGVFPLPLGTVGVDAIDIEDIAAVATIALTQDRLDGSVVPISGRDRLTGPSIAQTYTQLLGRPVIYCGDDLTRFGDLLRQIMPDASPWMIADTITMFGEFQRQGGHATLQEVEALEAILGRPVRRHADHAATLVRNFVQ
jgi:uncharacterized protein YbjT (DUF2867 family)